MTALPGIGLPVDDVLQAATVVSAESMGLDDNIGALRPGLSADLVGVSGDPVIDLVVASGEQFTPDPYPDLAVAMTTQCDHCLKVHARTAVEFGATDEELAETAYITAALRAGGGIVHGAKALGSIKRSGTA